MAWVNANSPANQLPGSTSGNCIKYGKRSCECKQERLAFGEEHCCWGFLLLKKEILFRVIEYRQTVKLLPLTASIAGYSRLPFVLNRLLKISVHPCSNRYLLTRFSPCRIDRRFWTYYDPAPNRPACPCNNACVSWLLKKYPDTKRLIWR